MGPKDTEFKKGNQAAKGANHALQAEVLKKNFKEKCLEFIQDTKMGLFPALQQIVVGYKGVRPPDRIAAGALMLKAVGMLSDKVEVEHKNPFEGLDNQTLIAAAESLTLAIKTNRAEVRILEDKSGRDGETQSPTGGN